MLNGYVSKESDSSVLIGSVDVFEILNQSEVQTTSKTYGYAQPKAIGQKPRPVANGKSLITYNLSQKLHFSFCNPTQIIKDLEEKAGNNEVFPYYQGDKYMGTFVVSSITYDPILSYGENILIADLKVDLLESPVDDESQYQQQKKEVKKPAGKLDTVRKKLQVPQKLTDKIESIPTPILMQGMGYLNDVSNGLASSLLASESVLDIALRQGQSYLNLNTNGISDELIGGKIDELLQ